MVPFSAHVLDTGLGAMTAEYTDERGVLEANHESCQAPGDES